MDSQEQVTASSPPVPSPATGDVILDSNHRQENEFLAPKGAIDSGSDDVWTDLRKSFTPLLGCLGWTVLPIVVLLGLIKLYGVFSAAVSAELARTRLSSLPISGTKVISYEFFIIVGLLLFIIVILSLFPLFLQRSFELTKKARIQSDVWIDLLSLGYWTKLRLSADANDQLTRDKNRNEIITGKTAFSKWAANVQALSAGDLAEGTSDPYVSALQQFTRRFEENYGRQAFSGPLVMVTILYTIGWLAVLFPNGLSGGAAPGISGITDMLSKGIGGYIQSVVNNLNIVTAAFLGSYLFSVQGLFRRYQRSDFKPISVTQASLRVLIAVIVAILVVILSEDIYKDQSVKWLHLFGFFTGLFSLQVLGFVWDVTVKRIPNWRSSRSGLANTELTELDGLDSWHQDRLDEAGINYVRGLATADFLDLLIAVRLPCETMVDWVDQAILRMHTDDKTWRKLHEDTPIRTATDLLDAITNNKDHRKHLIKIMDGDSAQSKNAAKPSFADTLVLMEDALRKDPNIAHIRVFREQMNQVVDHATAYPPNWPIILSQKVTVSKETTKVKTVIEPAQVQIPQTEQPAPGGA